MGPGIKLNYLFDILFVLLQDNELIISLLEINMWRKNQKPSITSIRDYA